MKTLPGRTGPALLIALLLTASLQAQEAELIFVGDNIITMDEATAGATAVAVGDGKILAVGEREAVLELRDEGTKVIELGQQALLPGFIDSHGHAGTQAKLLNLANLSPSPVGEVNSLKDLTRVLGQYITSKEIPAGQWVVGFGYDDSLLAEGRHPTRDDLDAITTEHPVFLIHTSGHLGVANSAALALQGITAESENPPGGVIRRRENSSEPDGVLEEAAAFAVFMALPQPSPEQSLQQLVAVQGFYASKGITTLQEGGATPHDLEVFRAAAEQGKLVLDLVAYPLWQADKAAMPELGEVGEYGGRFKVGGIKLSLDGSPQGKTAYFSQPYFVPPPGQPADYRGYPAYPQETVDQAVYAVMEKRLPLLAHANGDAAAEMLIEAVEKATRQLAVTDTRVVMIHAQTVRDDQLDRMAALGMIPSFFSAHTFFWGDWHRDSVLGPERAAGISPTRSALDRNIRFTLHNDAPVTPPAPIDLIWSTVNRRTRSNEILGPEQRVSTLEALKALTINGAYQYFEEDSKGSITPGKLADLVVLSTNPLTIAPERLRELTVQSTWSHGKQVWGQSQGTE